MIKILYIIEFTLASYGLYKNHMDTIIAAFILYNVSALWNSTRNELIQLNTKLESIPDKNQIIKDALKKSTEFKTLSWFQKIIYITAFNHGIEYILKKLK
jgi:hypothetical protein